MENAIRTVLETRILEIVNGSAGRNFVLDGAAQLLAVYGVLPLMVAAVFVAICSDQKWRRWGGWVTLISVVPATLSIWKLDQFLCRPRPFLCHPVRLLLCIPDSISFPSFEIGAAAALAFGLFAYGGKWRWLPLPYVCLLGIARVFCGIEYPLDQAWAVLTGSLAMLVMILALNPRHVFLREEGWPVATVGTFAVVAATVLFAHTPEMSVPPQQSTCRTAAPIVSAEEKNLIRGMSPKIEHAIAESLLKQSLPGRIRRIGVGTSESMSVAEVKFDAGPDSHPMSRIKMEREALAIIQTTFAAAPAASEVDVFGVTTWDHEGMKVLSVAYSVCAQRKDAALLTSNAMQSPHKALSRFGLAFYRIHRGLE